VKYQAQPKQLQNLYSNKKTKEQPIWQQGQGETVFLKDKEHSNVNHSFRGKEMAMGNIYETLVTLLPIQSIRQNQF
jgi:hypothetical protein